MLTVGQQFEGLRIKDTLAESPLTATYLAERPGKEKVVLKIFKDETFTRENEISYLRRAREAITQGKITNQAYLSFYKKVATVEVPQIGKRTILIRRYAAGKNMAEWRNSVAGLSEATNIFRKICLGLDHLHRAGLIHGGLCPQNIIIGDGTLKITDFGTGANFLNTVLKRVDPRSEIGFFLPPWFNDRYKFHHPATDIYALGAILYYLQTGLTPKGIPDNAIPPARRALTGAYKDVADFMQDLEQLIQEDGQIREFEGQIDDKKHKKGAKEANNKGGGRSPERVPEIEIQGENLQRQPSGLSYRLEKRLERKKERFTLVLNNPAEDGRSLRVNLAVAAGADWIQVNPGELMLAPGQQQFWITLGPLKDTETKRGKIVIEIPIGESGGRITREIIVSARLEKPDSQPKGIISKLKWVALLCAFFTGLFLVYETARYTFIYMPEISTLINQWFSGGSGTPTVESPAESLTDRLIRIENELLTQGDFLQAKYELEDLKTSHPSNDKVNGLLGKLTKSLNIRSDLNVYPGKTVRPEGVIKISSGNGFQLLFCPEDALYLYIIQTDSHDNLQQLFPNVNASRDHNPLKADALYQIPAGDDWFILDQKSGMETIYFLASRFPARDLEELVSRYDEADYENQKNQYRQQIVERIEARRQAQAENIGGCLYKEFSFWHEEDPSNLQKKIQETPRETFEASTQLAGRNEPLTPQEAENFVRQYVSAAGSGDIEEIMGFYGDEVDYYEAGKVDKDFIFSDKTSYYERWPIVENALIGEIVIESGDEANTKIVKFSIQFSVESRNRGQRISGAAFNVLKIQKTDNILKILDIKQKVLERTKGY